MSIVVTKEIAKTYGAQEVFEGVSLQIARGDRIGFVGPNGQGKTTLLKIVAGLEEPSQGTLSRQQGLRIGYLPQDDIIHKELTVEESLYYTARLRMTSDHTDREIKERIGKLLKQLDLYDKRKDIIGSVEQQVLSGG